MGLFTTLLTLPLAPVRGTVWIAEQISEQAMREFGDEAAIRRQLAELEVRYELGEIGDDEYERAENELLERLVAVRQLEAGGQGTRDARTRGGDDEHGS